MLGRILFESSKFAIFGGLVEWFQILSLEENVRFGLIQRSFFPNFGPDSAYIRPNLAKSMFDIHLFLLFKRFVKVWSLIFEKND